MTAAFTLFAREIDITPSIADRLISLRLTDEAGGEADSLDVEIDDRGGQIEIPETGVRLTVGLGTGGDHTSMGVFTVDEVAGRLSPRTMTIRAAAADMTGAIRAPVTRAWEGQTIASIARSIAARHGLSPAIDAVLGVRAVNFIAQSAESDLHLLTRLVAVHDGTAKIAGGRLVIARRGVGETAAGTSLIAPTVTGGSLSSLSWTIAKRENVGKVTAHWHDQAGGARQSVSAGEAEPSITLRHVFATGADAQAAAAAALNRGSRQTARLRASCSTFRPDLFAEVPIEIKDVRPGIDGRWVATRVTHELRGTLTTSFTAERALVR